MMAHLTKEKKKKGYKTQKVPELPSYDRISGEMQFNESTNINKE